jgi:hypothetical protein
MKKHLILGFFLSSVLCQAQTIPDSNFETWALPSYGSYEDPTGWMTINATMSYLGALPSVSKSTTAFSGTYAANVQNVLANYSGTDTLFGGYMSADVDITGQALPEYLKGHIKYSLAPGEQALISFAYKVVDTSGYETDYVIGIKRFEGSSASYIPFTIPTYAWYYPKRMSNVLSITISTYNYWGNGAVAVSSTSNLTVDSLAFGGTVTAPVVTAGPTISNGDFENWGSYENVTTPTNWFSIAALQELDTLAIIKSTDAYSGNFALQMAIDPVGFPQLEYTLLKPGLGSKFVQGYSKFDLAPGDTVVGYLSKYTTETGLDGQLIDSIVFTGSQATYQGFSLSFDGKIADGDTLALQFLAFRGGMLSHNRLETNSSTFLLDDVHLSAFPLGLDNAGSQPVGYTVSPNPSSTGVFQVKSSQKLDHLQVFDAWGKKVEASISANPTSTLLDISQHARGIYYVTQQDGDTKISFKIIY